VRRPLAPLLAGGLLVGGLAGLAWLTHHPEAPLLARAGDWPLVGPLAARFRAAYLPPPPPRAPVLVTVVVSAESGPHGGAPPPPAPAVRDFAFLAEGTALRTAPDLAAPVAATAAEVTRVRVEERRRGWGRVEGGGLAGWLVLPRPGEVPEPSPSGPDPVLPLATLRPDPGRLARAAELLGAGGSWRALGPYRTLTDVADGGLLAALAAAVEDLDAVYARRYGVPPQGPPQGVVVLLARHADYARLQEQEGLAGRVISGHTAGDVSALWEGGRHPLEVRATLVHELAHLLNRRALGPALPPWLDEGIAQDLAASGVDARGRLVPAELSEGRREDLVLGATVAALELQRAAEARALAPLAEVVAGDWERLSAGELRRRYDHAGFLVRYLADGRAADGFHAFLAAIARGGPATPEALLDALDTGWDELDPAFRRWLAERPTPQAAREVRRGGGPGGRLPAGG
jgi:hypothetical protein